MKDSVALYNKKRSVFAHAVMPCRIHVPDSFSPAPVTVVIPACAEYPGILETFDCLRSLKKAPAIMCTVNHREDAAAEIKENNRLLIAAALQYGVCVLDCTQPGSELKKNEGVGSARRIGMDYALLTGAQVIACMDADTLVCPQYGRYLHDFFVRCTALQTEGKKTLAGAVCAFTHQKAQNAPLQQAIDAYEFFIKEHSARLYAAGTPFYPYALGPSIVCSAQGYAEAGGMNRRVAGEDFYFLQALIKIHMQYDAALKKTERPDRFLFPELACTVYPQARLSDRTLFGTGQKLAGLLAGGCDVQKKDKTAVRASLLYPDTVYEKLAGLIGLFRERIKHPQDFPDVCAVSFPRVYDFLVRERFLHVWEKICAQNGKDSRRLECAFHTWFDGLKILRLIHYLTR